MTRRLTAAGLAAALLAGAVLLRDATSAPAPDLKPVAHWVFAPSAFVGPDLTPVVGDLTVRLAGGAAVRTDGPTPAVVFRGPNDYVKVRDRVTPVARFLPREAFTAAAWVRLDAAADHGGIFGCLQDNGPAQAGFLLGYDKTRFTFALATRGADDGDGKMTYLTGKTAYQLGRWYHVAAVYDGKTMALFVNGALDGESGEQSGPVLYAKSANLVIGRYQDENEDFPMAGAVREVLWCDRAVPPAELLAHFRADERLAADVPPPGLGFVIDPYLQYATGTAVAVLCETTAPARCVVEYGPTYPPALTAAADGVGTMHEVPLAGLQPNTKYYYRVRCETPDGARLDSKPLTLHTAVGPADAYSFGVIGDTQKNPTVTAKVAKLMWERRPHFVVHMGDVVDNGPDKAEWTDELFRPCQELFGRVPVYPCIGNHEQNHAHYYKYFRLPAPEYHYSFTYGNAEFFSLDSNKPLGPDSVQYKWLDAALAKSTAKWKFCYHHHPVYSSDSDDYGNTWKGPTAGGDRNAMELAALYEKHHVDFAMNGHIHVYERTWPVRAGRVDLKAGVRYLTSGGGGGGLEDFGPAPRFFQNQLRSCHHFCHFTVSGGRLEAKVFDDDGRLFDSFEVTKE